MSAEIDVHTEEYVLMPNHQDVGFNVYLDGERVQCVITGAALKSQFNSPDRPSMEIFEDNQDVIASMATFLLTTRPEQVDGAVIIRPEDLKNYPMT